MNYVSHVINIVSVVVIIALLASWIIITVIDIYNDNPEKCDLLKACPRCQRALLNVPISKREILQFCPHCKHTISHYKDENGKWRSNIGN